jgi:hypothetical protein
MINNRDSKEVSSNEIDEKDNHNDNEIDEKNNDNDNVGRVTEIKEMEIVSKTKDVDEDVDEDDDKNRPSKMVNNFSLNKMEKGDLKQDENRKGDKVENISEEESDEDEDEEPWIPPSIKEANIFKSKSIYKGGVEKLTRINLSTEYKELGVGVAIHFLFLKIMTKTFFIMSIMSIPAILFAFFGSRIPYESQDGLGFYRLMVGNIGYDHNSPTYIPDSSCYLPDGK